MSIKTRLNLVGLAYLAIAPALLAGALLTNAGPVHAACGALPTSLGSVTMTVNVPSSGPYRIWVRELAPSAAASGFYLQLADAGLCQVTMGNASIPAKTWTWVDYQNGNPASVVSATVTAGNHAVELAGLSRGTEIDKVELLTDIGCTPTGDGSNCTASAVTATISPIAAGSPSPSGAPAVNNENQPAATGSTSGHTTLQGAAHIYLWPAAAVAVLAVLAAGWLIFRNLVRPHAATPAPEPMQIAPENQSQEPENPESHA